MEDIKTLYAIPHYNCNLACPHCDLFKKQTNYDEEHFMYSLNNVNAEEIVLFGGEPLLYKDKLLKILQTNKISSISTNLLNIDLDILNNLKKYNIHIATSWNNIRLNKQQYMTWINNIHKINTYNIDCIVLITLTDDLIHNVEKLTDTLTDLDKTKIRGVLFEQLLDYSKDQNFYEKVDTFLCKISENWQYSFKNLIIDKLNTWNCDCKKTYTLEPTGIIRKGCPQYIQPQIVNECLSCSLANICKPCPLQKHCSFPKKLYMMFKNA